MARDDDGAGRASAQPVSAQPVKNAFAYQERALAGVSRTFALTIPQLPRPLRDVVGNAYLLCRIADTVEDEPTLPRARKTLLLGEFRRVVAGDASAEQFAAALGALLSGATADSERDLVAHAPLVLGATHRLRPVQRAAIERCIGAMIAGMAAFGGGPRHGFATFSELERYTHCVAGVVGELLTDLFCDYSEEIAVRRENLLPLAAQFGRGLQLVNILKDVWEDQLRGTCWLPRSAFAPDLDLASPETSGSPAFIDGLTTLVAAARDYLDAAFEYVLLIPPQQTGIRRFLLWTLGLAVLTLRRIHANPHYASGDEVKVSRRAVRATIIASRAAVRSDAVLAWMFRAASAPLPRSAAPRPS